MVFSLVIWRKLWYPVTEVMTMASKAAIKRIIETLKDIYPDALCSLQYDKDYELLFAVRLSAQCTDERVNKVTPALFARFPTLESFAEADPKEVGEYIHSCGFFNGKARDLVSCAQQLLEKHGGKVPGTMEELTALMKYITGPNAAYIRQLAGLAAELEKAGDHTAYAQVMAAVSDFEKGSLRLSVVLASLEHQ